MNHFCSGQTYIYKRPNVYALIGLILETLPLYTFDTLYAAAMAASVSSNWVIFDLH